MRGAQLLLAGTVLQQYCTAGDEEDDESEDGSDVIDVRRSTPHAFALVHNFFLQTGDCERDHPAIPG